MRIPLVPILTGLLLFTLLGTRYSYLDFQAFHHDESIHCLHSWNIVYSRSGPKSYRYDPVYHGPFLYHFGALFHTFLPDTDAAARIPYATVGIFLVLLVLLWGKRLGWGTALLICGFLTLSPTIDYFSRFARNDVYQTAWLAGLVVAGTLYLWTRRIRYLTAVAFFLVLSYCTKENSYVNNFGPCLFLMGWGGWRLFRQGKKALREILEHYLPLVRLLILFGAFSVFTFCYVAIDCRVGPRTGLIQGIVRILTHSTSLTEKTTGAAFHGEQGYFSGKERESIRRNYYRLAFGATFVLLMLAEVLSVVVAGRKPVRPGLSRGVFHLSGVALFYLLLGYGLVSLRNWIQTEAVTADFFKDFGLRLIAFFSALVAASLLPWIPSIGDRVRKTPDEVSKGSETPEDVVSSCRNVFFSLAGLAVQVNLAVFVYTLLFSSLGTNIRRGTTAGLYNYLSYWFRHQTGDFRIWGTWWYFLPRLLLYELLPLVTAVVALSFLFGFFIRRFLGHRFQKVSLSDPGKTDSPMKKKAPMTAHEASEAPAPPPPTVLWKPVPTPLLAFSGFLVLYFVGIYALLNEKVPWLITYQSFALHLFAGLAAGHCLAVLPDPLAGRWVERSEPYAGPLVTRLQEMIRYRSDRNVPRKMWLRILILRWIVVFLFAGLIGFTIQQHLVAVFYRPDHPTELLVYTATTHRFGEQMKRIRRLSMQAEEDGRKLRIAVHGKSEWPCAWYFRNEEVTWKRIDLTRDVQILDDTPENRRRMTPRRGNLWDLVPCDLRAWWIWPGTPKALPGELAWWPNVKAFLSNARHDRRSYFPEPQRPPVGEYPTRFREQVLNYVFRRRIWYPVGGEPVLVCYKTDEKVPEEMSEGYLEGSEAPPRSLTAVFSFGKKGAAPGRFLEPRGLAVTPEGHLAVADSKNGRIQVFSSTGEWIFEFGRGTLSAEVSGVSDLVCDKKGYFYVADTWNHAIRKFSPEGKLLATAKQARQGERTLPLFGPRGIALNSGGRVFVTDTGNHAVRVFAPDLRPLFSWGGPGSEQGRFSEPVGIAVDQRDRVYVADTGNGRIQRFSPDGVFQEQYLTITPSEPERVQVEPNLACLPDGRIVFSASLFRQVWVIDPLKKTVQLYRPVRPAFRLPCGLAIDGNGDLWMSGRRQALVARFRIP